MNRKAIERALADGVELAWSNRSSLARETSLGQRKLVRVRVLAVDSNREIPDSVPRYLRNDQRRRSVKIQVVDVTHDHLGRSAKPGDELWVEPRFLVDSWAAYEDARIKSERVRREQGEATKQKDAKVGRDAIELSEILQHHGLQPERVKRTPSHYSTEGSTAVVTLTLAEVKLLVGEADPGPPASPSPIDLRSAAWVDVLTQCQASDTCFCGKPKGHAGWMACASREVHGQHVLPARPAETTKDLRTHVGGGLFVKPLGHTPPGP
jgi:hypothetical protein